MNKLYMLTCGINIYIWQKLGKFSGYAEQHFVEGMLIHVHVITSDSP